MGHSCCCCFDPYHSLDVGFHQEEHRVFKVVLCLCNLYIWHKVFAQMLCMYVHHIACAGVLVLSSCVGDDPVSHRLSSPLPVLASDSVDKLPMVDYHQYSWPMHAPLMCYSACGVQVVFNWTTLSSTLR